MKEYKEFWVGCFVIIGVILLLYSSIFFSGGGVLVGRNYKIQAIFSNASGLHTGASVCIAGVPIGRVDAIKLTPEHSMALVTLAINKDIALPEDTIASIKSSGLLGEKYIQLLLGSSRNLLTEGEEIFETQSPLDLEDLLGKFVFGSAS